MGNGKMNRTQMKAAQKAAAETARRKTQESRDKRTGISRGRAVGQAATPQPA